MADVRPHPPPPPHITEITAKVDTPPLPSPPVVEIKQDIVVHMVQEDEKQQLLRHEEQILRHEEQHHQDTLDIKRQLITTELDKIARLMAHYQKHGKKLSRLNSLTKTAITTTTVLGTIGLYFNVGNAAQDFNLAVYYTVCIATSVSAILSALSNSWNFAERAHTNITSYKGLHNLHDFVSFQVARNNFTSLQMDELLSNMSTRLILIRDSAEEGS